MHAVIGRTTIKIITGADAAATAAALATTAAATAAAAAAAAVVAVVTSKKDRSSADITVATLLQLVPADKTDKGARCPPAAPGGDKKKRAGGSRGVRLNYDTAYATDPSRSIRSPRYEYRIKS